jgi:hypothetical protein
MNKRWGRFSSDHLLSSVVPNHRWPALTWKKEKIGLYQRAASAAPFPLLCLPMSSAEEVETTAEAGSILALYGAPEGAP